MSRVAQQRVAAGLTALSGLVVLLAAGGLVADAVTARRQLTHYQARIDELLQQVRTSAVVSASLQRTYDEQTAATLARQHRVNRLAWTLVAASVAFLVSGRWLWSHRGRGVPAEVLARSCAVRAGAPHGPAAGRQLPVVEAVDLAAVDVIVARLGRGPESAIPILQAIQAHYRHVPDAALHRVCETTDITPAQLTSLATFYPRFRGTPIGEHVITVCHGTACHVAGAAHISDELRRRLGIAPGTDTDAERKFTVQEVPCLGCCTLAPVVQIDDATHGHARADTVARLLDRIVTGTNGQLSTSTVTVRERLDRTATVRERPDLAATGGLSPIRAATVRERSVAEIRLGLGSCCIANGSAAVHDALEAELAAIGALAVVKPVGCVGMCHQTPVVEIDLPGRPPLRYSHVRPEQVRGLVRRHFRPPGLLGRVRHGLSQLAAAARNGEFARSASDGPSTSARPLELRDPPVAAFLGPQKHIATEHCGDLDPLDLGEYLARDGFAALKRCREQPLSGVDIIEQVRRSGLRGRGGAGFPTWRKWQKVRQAAGEPKYVICNGDEGDPGAFMDRMLMESYPYRVIEGMAIAAAATGATEGVFYIRAEYPLAVERISAAIERGQQRDLLGPLHLRVVQGAGAFICGEETALIATLEGRRGTPTLRPPYPSQRGLWGRPTLVNNVETFAVVPWIIRHGPDAFAALGTGDSRGTKVFALTGKVRRGGLIEVPMGVTIRQIVEDIGGGVRADATPAGTRRHTFKAVQIGGPSGGCLPAALADTPVDYEDLAAVGAIMGSGGLVVLDETDCMVDIARYFLSFTQAQSCGHCVPCRIGTRRMLEILERLCAGDGRPDDVAKLEHLATMVQGGSLCGLGKTAPNPVLTTLRYFREEYEAHLQGRCPAGKCKALIRYEINDGCTGCTLCAQHCPAGAIALRPYERHAVDDAKCTRCDVCRSWCPEDAIRVV
ncbi:MAG: NAD(P)H-dependent oxidoreductase subunit E [Planctomycetota bacterium]